MLWTPPEPGQGEREEEWGQTTSSDQHCSNMEVVASTWQTRPFVHPALWWFFWWPPCWGHLPERNNAFHLAIQDALTPNSIAANPPVSSSWFVLSLRADPLGGVISRQPAPGFPLRWLLYPMDDRMTPALATREGNVICSPFCPLSSPYYWEQSHQSFPFGLLLTLSPPSCVKLSQEFSLNPG